MIEVNEKANSYGIVINNDFELPIKIYNPEGELFATTNNVIIFEDICRQIFEKVMKGFYCIDHLGNRHEITPIKRTYPKNLDDYRDILINIIRARKLWE